ncbi:MAG: GTPase [Candidatus Bilamarchaeum sp.]|jgi:ribosome biogenesis GTPase A
MPETRRRSILKEIRSKDGKRRSANWDLLKDLIREADVVVEIVDARDVPGTRLPLAEKWAGSNRLLIVANKSDLVIDKSRLLPLSHGGIYVSAKDQSSKTRNAILEAIKKRARTLPARGVVVGYPNVGKSSILNLLAHRKAAKVSPIAGTTTHVQWIRVSEDVIINDYPGVFPRYEKPSNLIRKGALNVSEDVEGPAYKFLIEALEKPNLMSWLEKFYDVDLSNANDPEAVLETIAKRRGWLIKGGEPNTDEAARSLVRAMREAPEI